ncbi:MAG: pyridoxal-dependent decarboxylase, exosortase A system-associated [Pseudomonadota bacterium]
MSSATKTKTPPVHVPHAFFNTGAPNGFLEVDGRPLNLLVEEAGGTPLFIYSRRAMAHRVEQLREAMPSALHLHYAMKANPMPAVVGYMAGLVDGLDVASGAELRVALDAGMSAENISFAGPGKQVGELTQAVAAGATINLESEAEMRKVAAIAERLDCPGKVAIRVNPDFQLKGSGMKMGGGSQQFGVDAERVPAMLRELATLPLQFVGLHIYSGSQNLRADAIIDAQSKTLALAAELASHTPVPMQHVNIGGGLGIPYFPGETPLDLAAVGAALEQQLASLPAVLQQTQIVMELGRYLVGEAGLYVCRVVDRKISRGHPFLITDGGLHHQLAASGNFGQVLRKNYPVLLASRMHEQEREVQSVVGPLCTPLDLLGDRMALAPADEGDLVAVLQSGAYGPTASPAAFLSHPSARQMLV